MSILSKPYFHDEKAAYAYLESIVWADGAFCPHCGNAGKIYALEGKTTRIGLKKCGECRKQFTVKVGTVFESSHIPLHKWLQAAYLLSASKKGMSAHQLHRILEITYKSAWFMCHRLREAMRSTDATQMGGNGKYVEADETYIGNSGRNFKGTRGPWHKEKVLSLVDRTTGKAISFHIDGVKAKDMSAFVSGRIALDTTYMTDEATAHKLLGHKFQKHETVAHRHKEYVRGNAHTNTVEGFFSIFKRGMKGVYQHCSSTHLQRYLDEFDFRYTEREKTDAERSEIALKGIVGKRLMYRQSFTQNAQ